MYIISAETFGHWGSWADFVGVFSSLDEAIPTMREHSEFYGKKLGKVVWKEGDQGLKYFNGLEYTAIKVELS